MRSRARFLISFLMFLIFSEAFSEELVNLRLQGYLGQEEVKEANDTLDKLQKNQSGPIIIHINSTAGDLTQVFTLAKNIYELKQEKKFKIVIYIEDNAIGPAAILPFLADELYISRFVSWGDIPLGVEKVFATNLLRSKVAGLISPAAPHADLLKLLAAAMADPSLRIVSDNGWKLSTDKDNTTHPVITSGAETLVVNQNQLKELEVIAGTLSKEKFQDLFHRAPAENSVPAATTFLNTHAPEITPLEKSLMDHIKFTKEGPNLVGMITINNRTSGINQSTWLYVKKALDYYKEKKPIFILLQLDTPGGEAYSSQQISDALKELDTQYNIPVVAIINNWAISAGAMLAYSCRYIAVVKDASMGAAEPITLDPTGKMEQASEKINSALRTDFANRAAFFGRNPLIAEGMVDKDIILVKRYNKIIKLDQEDQIRRTGADPDVLIKAKGKLLTLTSQQLIEEGIADISLPPRQLAPLTDRERETGKWPAEKTLLFTSPYFNTIPHAEIDEFRMDWKLMFLAFLAHPAVASLLFLGLILGFYVEINTPGFGLGGTIALTSLFLITLSSFALEIAGWLELILLLTGILILCIELFILPTFGLLGILGILFCIVGLFGMMLPGAGSVSFEYDTRTFNAAGEMFFHRLGWLSGALVAAFALIFMLGKWVSPRMAGFRKFVLTGSEQQGYLAVDANALLPPPGAVGEVLATLRPAGKVLIENRIYDALSTGALIEKGEKVVVKHVEGGTLIVLTLGNHA